MELPKEILGEIGRRINRPRDWRNFALTCRNFYLIATSLTAQKKKQFIRLSKISNIVSNNLYNERYWIYPNGKRHGYSVVWSYSGHKKCGYYKDGKKEGYFFVYNYRRGKNDSLYGVTGLYSTEYYKNDVLIRTRYKSTPEEGINHKFKQIFFRKNIALISFFGYKKRILKTECYISGKLTGFVKSYNESGTLTSTSVAHSFNSHKFIRVYKRVNGDDVTLTFLDNKLYGRARIIRNSGESIFIENLTQHSSGSIIGNGIVKKRSQNGKLESVGALGYRKMASLFLPYL